MFSNLINLFASAVRLVVDGVKELLGSATQDEAELITSKLTSAFVIMTALVLLFVPGLRQWSDHLFRVGFQLWNHHPVHPLSGKVL